MLPQDCRVLVNHCRTCWTCSCGAAVRLAAQSLSTQLFVTIEMFVQPSYSNPAGRAGRLPARAAVRLAARGAAAAGRRPRRGGGVHQPQGEDDDDLGIIEHNDTGWLQVRVWSILPIGVSNTGSIVHLSNPRRYNVRNPHGYSVTWSTFFCRRWTLRGVGWRAITRRSS